MNIKNILGLNQASKSIDEINVRKLLLMQFTTIIFMYVVFGIRTTLDSPTMSSALDNLYTTTSNYDPENHTIEHRYLKPLGLWFSYPFKFLGNQNAFILTASIFQIMIIPYFYYTSMEITGSSKLSLYSSLLFIFSPITLHFTVNVMFDTGTWFFYFVTFYYSYKEFQKEFPSLRNLFFLSLLCGVSSLMKLHGGSAIIYVNLMLIFTDRYKEEMVERIKPLFITSFGYVLPLLLNSIVVYHFYDFTYYDYVLFLKNNFYANQTIWSILASIKNSFGFFIFFAVYFYIVKEKYYDKEFNFILFSALIICLVTLTRNRLLFISAPIIIPISIMGILLFVENYFNSFSLKAKDATAYIIFFVLLLNYIIFMDNIEFALSMLNIN